jgi:hypothetical protein
MNQSEGKLAPKEYSFVTQDIATNEQSGPLTLLRRSKRVLGDIDLGEASIPTQSGRWTSSFGHLSSVELPYFLGFDPNA